MGEENYGATALDSQVTEELTSPATEPEADIQDAPEAEAPVAEATQTPEQTPNDEAEPDGEIDYERLMAEDTEKLRAIFPELRNLNSIADLGCAMRYAALRDLGLSCEEAYLAARGRVTKRNNRTHLSAAVTASAQGRGTIPRGELRVAREIFPDLTDSELQRLYSRVVG